MDSFGFGSPGLSVSDLSQPQNVVQLGVEPVRIDILSGVSGISSFKDAYSRKNLLVTSEGLRIDYISYQDLIANKSETDRLQDQRDIFELEKIRKKKGAQ